MSTPSPLPASGVDRPRRTKRPLGADENRQVSTVIAPGPRKLVRPSLAAQGLGSQGFADDIGRARRGRKVSFPQPFRDRFPQALEESRREIHYAETFYLQKQARGRTRMVVVLEDGEQIEGYIEWYDRHTIKIRHGGCSLIYKTSIKYLYKAGDTLPS